MALLVSNEIISAIEDELRCAKKSVQIISAYCKSDSIKKLAGVINPVVKDKRIMIRFRMDDILKGSTDFEALKYCLNEGWKVYVRFDLHAKTYIVDNKRSIVGSANVTKSGLTGYKNNNIEMATLVEIGERDRKKIEKLFMEAIPVDCTILEQFRRQLETVDINNHEKTLQWNKEITDFFKPHVDTLFSYELPEKSKYKKNEYIQFLDLEYNWDIYDIKEKLRWSNVYLWLLNVLEKKGGESYFGELSSELHNALVEDPKPYRKDVKVLLSNLLSLIEKWSMNEIVIDRPNYSQRVRIIN